MNRFELSVEIKSQTSTDGDTSLVLIPEIRIDDILYGEQLALNWRHLFSTLRYDGPFYPFTCDCGVPECAGIWHPVLVCRDDTSVYWTVPSPLVENEQKHDGQTNAIRFEFSRRDYWESVWQGWRKACALIQADSANEIGPHGFERDDLLALDRWIESTDSMPWNQRKAWNDFHTAPTNTEKRA